MANWLKENWFKFLLLMFIAYAAVGSYLYLGIQYGEHRQKSIERMFDICGEASNDDTMSRCAAGFHGLTVKTLFLFRPIIGK